MASADVRKELLDCSICLNMYTDPVTLRCGHNFCRVCIDRVLDTQEGSGVYSCPECRAESEERPVLIKNITLCNIVESFLFTPAQEETLILCTHCVDSPVPAVKSCLLCEASLCDKHMRVHSKAPEHVLTDPTTTLGNRKCSIHRELLKYYCTEDSACICVSCRLDGEHRGHQVEMLDEVFEKKKKRLRNVLQELITKREETERQVLTLQERRRMIPVKAADATERTTAEIKDIRRQLEELERRVLSEISRQEEQLSLSLSKLIQELEIKKDELSRKIRHVEDLCNMTDPLTVLQSETKDTDDAEGGDDKHRKSHDEHLHDGGDLDVTLISHTLNTGLSDILTCVKQAIFMPKATEILLDVNTAGNNLCISDDRKTASWSDRIENYPKNPERFENNKVLSSTNFSSGLHYWEVEITGSANWIIGMCYSSMERKGNKSWIGYNNKSWGLRMLINHYWVRHENKQVQLPQTVGGNRLRVYLDYEAGRLSFYELRDPIRHLHTFITTFTEPLHAVLCLEKSISITISGERGRSGTAEN